MNTKATKNHFAWDNQPEPFTPGITKEMVRERLGRSLPGKLPHELTLEEWVLAERDLVKELQEPRCCQHSSLRVVPSRASHKQKTLHTVEFVRGRDGDQSRKTKR